MHQTTVREQGRGDPAEGLQALRIRPGRGHQLVFSPFLPTYASWRNAIEKIRRGHKPAVLHLHPFAPSPDPFRRLVAEFLLQFQNGLDALLLGPLPE